MADTIRSTADILALYPLAKERRISAQDERDAIVSMIGTYGSIYETDGAANISATTASKEILMPTAGEYAGTTLHPGHHIGGSPQRARISVDVAGGYRMGGYVTFTSNSSSTVLIVDIVHEVVRPSGSGLQDTMGKSVVYPIAADKLMTVQMSTQADVDKNYIAGRPIAAGDSFWLGLRTEASTATVTIKQGQFWIIRTS